MMHWTPLEIVTHDGVFRDSQELAGIAWLSIKDYSQIWALPYSMLNENRQKESYLFILPWELSSLGGVNQVVENLYRQMEQDGRFNPMIMVNSWGDVRFKKKAVNGIDHFFFRLRSPWDSASKTYNCLAYCLDLFRMAWRFKIGRASCRERV